MLLYIFNLYILFIYFILNGDWGLGIGDWGLGIGDWAQFPIPKPPSPKPKPQNKKDNYNLLILFFLK